MSPRRFLHFVSLTHYHYYFFFPDCEIKSGWLGISRKVKSHCNTVLLHVDLLFMCEQITCPEKMLCVTKSFWPSSLQLGVGWGQRQAWPLLSEAGGPKPPVGLEQEAEELMEDQKRCFWLGKYTHFALGIFTSCWKTITYSALQSIFFIRIKQPSSRELGSIEIITPAEPPLLLRYRICSLLVRHKIRINFHR